MTYEKFTFINFKQIEREEDFFRTLHGTHDDQVAIEDLFNLPPTPRTCRNQITKSRYSYKEALLKNLKVQSGEVPPHPKLTRQNAMHIAYSSLDPTTQFSRIVATSNNVTINYINANKRKLDQILANNSKVCIAEYKVKRRVNLQSGEEEVVQNLTFSDETSGSVVAGESASLNCLGDNTPAVELGDFLKRPVLIKEIAWAMTDGVQEALTSFNPWTDFLNHSLIRNKLNNYAFVRCNIKLKFVINASPFYYGCSQFSYLPLSGLKADTNGTIFSGEGALVPHSQRMSVFVYPSASQGGEMILPFFYNQNWLELKDTTTTDNMGKISFNIFNQLRSANGASGTSLNVQVFAWAENIELMGPTSKLALQSGEDEYSTAGSISKPASAIAAGLGMLGEIPVIGPFMTASSIVASAVGSVAHIFGYTNVPHIAPTASYKNAPFAQMASPEISTPVEKLTIDPKNELTIDSRVDGLDGKDELDMKYIVQKDSFLTNLIINETTAEGDSLFACRVNPLQLRSTTVSGSFRAYNLLPMSYLSSLFSYWRGDIIFTFKTIATPYHKGRVRINFDPVANITTDGNSDQMTTTFTRIIDIGVDNNIEIIVPYMQAKSWLKTRDFSSGELNNDQFKTDGLTLTHDNNYDNGVITVKLLTNLTAPVTSTTINMQVWVRAGSNFEYAAPKSHIEDFSHLTVQSGENLDVTQTTSAGTQSGQEHPKRYLVNMGESICSLRSILRRPNLVGMIGLQVDTDTDDINHDLIHINRFPRPYGYTANGYSEADLQIAVGTGQFNFVKMTSINYLSEMFRGYKGSINWKANHVHTGPDLFSQFSIERTPISFGSYYHRTTLSADR